LRSEHQEFETLNGGEAKLQEVRFYLKVHKAFAANKTGKD
jgi:hypothetical protein